MKKFILFAALLALLVGSAEGQQAPPPAKTTTIDVPGVGKVVLVNREQLRFKGHGRTFRMPRNAQALLDAAPKPPSAFDHTKGGTLKFPILGNNQYGDCYYAAVAHASQCYTGNSGEECVFDVKQLTRRYLKLSGGDNGLDDEMIMPEWKHGIVGPSGPRKIIDEMTVDVHDVQAQRLACWAFGGLIWTCNLESNWVRNPKAGQVWDAGQGRGVGGHAMFITGMQPNDNAEVQTWGIGPPYIQVTHRGVVEAQSEFIVAFSLDQFTPEGKSAFTGLSYDQTAKLWEAMGGKPLPPSPFPPPKPDPGPDPTPTPCPHFAGLHVGVWTFLAGVVLASAVFGLLKLRKVL